MTTFLLATLLIIAMVVLVSLVRVYIGPTTFDRLVGVTLVSVNGVIALVVLGFAFDRAELFLDIALGFALLAFLLPIAFGKYVERRSDEEVREQT